MLQAARSQPVGDRVAHKNWKVRCEVYEEIKASCQRVFSSEDPILSQYGEYRPLYGSQSRKLASSCGMWGPPSTRYGELQHWQSAFQSPYQVSACLQWASFLRRWQTLMLLPWTRRWRRCLHCSARLMSLWLPGKALQALRLPPLAFESPPLPLPVLDSNELCLSGQV